MAVRDIVQAAAGVGGGAEPVYVEDVFSTYLYTGTGSARTITNGITFAGAATNGTILQLSGDSIADVSPIPSSLTNIGSVTVNTTTKKYGTGSLYFNGSSKLVTSANNTIPISASEDFTIEAWIYPTVVTNDSTLYCIATPRSGSGAWYFGIYFGKLFYYDEATSTFYANATITANTWQHVAFSRQGSTHRLFLNGVLTDTKTATPQAHAFDKISIGSDDSASAAVISGFYGYIDDLRVTKGTARYTANFTTPTAALPLDTLFGGQGGMLWIKNRTNPRSNRITDTVRGATKSLFTDLTNAETVETTAVTQFTSSGFVINSNVGVNENTNNIASWSFRRQAKFFDIVTFVAGSSTDRRISHSLESVPGFWIMKATNLSGMNWPCYHTSLGLNNAIDLNLNGAASPGSNRWGTAPTSTTIGINEANMCVAGYTYILYIFAHDAGGFGDNGDQSIIKCGSMVAPSTGTTVNLGWEPQWILYKPSSGTGDWKVVDNMRGWRVGPSGTNARLTPNSNSSEVLEDDLYIRSNGFYWNSGTSNTIIYIAIRRGPMKTPTTGTSVYKSVTRSGTGSTPWVASGAGFPPDMTIMSGRDGSAAANLGSSFQHSVIDRLRRATEHIQTTNTSAEGGGWGSGHIHNMDGYDGLYTSDNSYYNGSSSTYVDHHFRRAPGFFDVVCYTGAAANVTVSHNLGVAPELMIVKTRDFVYSWYVANRNTSQTLSLNSNTVPFATSGLTTTSTTFTVNDGSYFNIGAYTYVAYLFASCPGVSKVGSYTGNGGSQTINCGFTTGARFVLIKRTDAEGDWVVFDSARGIIAGNDPFLRLNSGATETGTDRDSIDPANSGFIINDTGLFPFLNVSGATYIYLAIA